MEFRSKFDIAPSLEKIKYTDHLFFIGSCFSNNISKILQQRKFDTLSNPFGILYNPISVFENLKNIIHQKEYTEKDLFLKDEVWNCFSFHSDISGTDKQAVLVNINKQINNSHTFIAKTNTIFITLGTAWVYETDNQIVANCFKIDAKKFNKRLLTIDEIFNSAQNIIQEIKKFNKDLKIAFTVSPVRHLKDGFVENSQSKSTLILAIKKIAEQFETTSYFPAYEFLMDDLRDYRFYDTDMVHPNKLAISYIVEKFDKHYFSAETFENVKKIEKIITSLNHIVRFKETQSHSKFKKNLLKKIEEMEKKGFDFSKEKESMLYN